jgi:uncharacterized protein (DUF1697 family)
VALVVFLRGVNVGGHKTFRPRVLADQLKHLDVVNIGAAGTFVIRRTVTRTTLRAELARSLPFETEVMICEGLEMLRMMSVDPFADQPERPDLVRFASVMSRRPRTPPQTPLCCPPAGTWVLKVLAIDHPFVLGLYRRQMKAIGYLGTLDRIVGVPVTTRNWNTMTAIARVLRNAPNLDGAP